MNTTLESEPMGFVDRLKTAGQVVVTGKVPNPLENEPKDPSRASLVKELNQWCKDEREFWKDTYERMQDEQEFAAGNQWSKEYKSRSGDGEGYVGDIVQQLVNRVTASLYAKNPSPDAQRLEKMMFEKWDGSNESIRGAEAILANPGLLLQHGASPEAAQVILAAQQEIKADYEQGMAEKQLLDNIAKTAQLLIKHRWKTHKPDFKVLMKQAVTQAVVSRVAFIQVDYQRDMEQSPSPDATAGVAERLAAIEQKTKALELSDDKQSSSLREELRLMTQSLEKLFQDEGGAITFEGTVYQLVPATSMIIDRRCTCLTEFLNARRIARQTLMDVAEAERRYGVSLKDCGAVLYGEDGCVQMEADDRGRVTDTEANSNPRPRVCIWHLYDKDQGLCYVICDGVKDFLPRLKGEPNEPYEPTPAVERFWPFVAITLNAQVVEMNKPELDVTIYPRSHVRLQMPMQVDINKSGEGLREHRVANRPRWGAIGAKWKEGDLEKLSSPAVAHDCLRLESIAPGEKVADFLQPIPTQPVDRNLYDPSPSLQAAMLATGLQPANLGAQGGEEKATGQAIAEGARISADQSNVDGLDGALSVLAQMTWEMEIQETSEQTVKSICGRGAVWTQLRRADVQKEIFIDVEAGSSGRPNEALAAQKFKEIAPLLIPMLQQAGIPIDVLIKEALRILGVKLDVDEMLRKAQAGQASAMPPMGQAPGGMPGPGGPQPVRPGGAAPNVAAGGVPGAPPLPPQQRQQMARTAVN